MQHWPCQAPRMMTTYLHWHQAGHFDCFSNIVVLNACITFFLTLKVPFMLYSGICGTYLQYGKQSDLRTCIWFLQHMLVFLLVTAAVITRSHIHMLLLASRSEHSVAADNQLMCIVLCLSNRATALLPFILAFDGLYSYLLFFYEDSKHAK